MPKNKSFYKFIPGYLYNLKYSGGSHPDAERIILCLSNTDEYKIDVSDVVDGKQKTYYRYKCYDIIQLSHQSAISKATLLDRISQLEPEQLSKIYQKYVLVNNENCQHIGNDIYSIWENKPKLDIKLLSIGNRCFETDENGNICTYIGSVINGEDVAFNKEIISQEQLLSYINNNAL
jgi:hypothetical protein